MTDRMPPIAAEQMSAAQREAAAELIATPRGAVLGPFIPMLRSPELLRRAQRLGEYLRYHSALPKRLNEMVILITARRWTQQTEWHIHYPIALEAGVKRELADAIAQGRRPDGMARDEAVVWEFCTELYDKRSVSDATYDAARALLGEQGVVDMVGVVGYYSLLAMMMNVARTALPAGVAPPLKGFPD